MSSQPVRQADAGGGQPAPRRIAFQGRFGAFADLACRTAYPGWSTLPYHTAERAAAAVSQGEADLVMLPCDNSIVGRVPDIHRLLPETGLFVVGEHFQPVAHCLVAPPGATLADLRRVHSHPVALDQTQRFLSGLSAEPVAQSNTAAAAELVAQRGDPQEAAIASDLAAALYGLTILKRNIEDEPGNTTRFYVLAAEPCVPPAGSCPVLTAVVFRVLNRPAALHRALGGFARHGVNLTKLESYVDGGQFVATRFLCEFEGHPETPEAAAALEELACAAAELTVLGVFPLASPHLRARAAGPDFTAILRSKPLRPGEQAARAHA